ncbi:MAG: FAD-binding protein [Elusimicrobia bacterium]|nr:FAD-binding protein [Elusimicrobiota bacterium]
MPISELFSSDPGDLYLASIDQGQIPDILRQTFIGQPRARVTISSKNALAETLAWANERKISVIARGAGSSGFGQVLPRDRALILDLSFLNRILQVNTREKWIRAEGGARWSDLDHYLESDGQTIGSYPSSYYTTVAGWVNTGGLGLCSYRFGHIKEQILEMEIIDATGEFHTLKPGDEAFEGYFSSEGQLGVLTSLTLKIRQRPKNVYPRLIGFPGAEAAFKFIKCLSQEKFSITDLTYLSREKAAHLEHGLAEKMNKKGSPMKEPLLKSQDYVFALLEDEQESRRFDEYLEKADLAISRQQLRERSAASLVWFERFYPMKGKSASNFFLGNEALVPLNRASAYMEKLRSINSQRRLHDPAFEAHIIRPQGEKTQCLFLAYYSVPRDSERLFSNLAAAIDFDIAAKKMNGRIYPIGIYKTPLLSWKFSGKEIRRLQRLKGRYDPNDILNPGKFFSWARGLTGVQRIFWKLLTIAAPLGMRGFSRLAPFLDHFFGKRLAETQKPAVAAIKDDPVLRSAFECVQCGFCLPVCPAYLTTKDEKTTARGKLQLYAASKTSAALTWSALDAQSVQLCMHCAGCTKVCQSEIDLVPAWHQLEKNVAGRHGQPVDAIRGFINNVEKNPDYHRLLREGTIVQEAPKNIPALSSGL